MYVSTAIYKGTDVSLAVFMVTELSIAIVKATCVFVTTDRNTDVSLTIQRAKTTNVSILVLGSVFFGIGMSLYIPKARRFEPGNRKKVIICENLSVDKETLDALSDPERSMNA